jgi:hypothetical protein
VEKWINGLLFVIAVTISTEARSLVVAFEDSASGNCAGPTTLDTSEGFSFSSTHQHICDSTRTDLVSNGSNYLSTEEPVVITMVDLGGGRFNISQIDLAEQALSPDITNATSVRITGYRFGGTTVVGTFTLDGIADGAGGVDDFETFELHFANLLFLTFEGLGAVPPGTFGPAFSVDNIVVRRIAEPATLALLGIGLAGLAFSRRKRIAS